MNTGKHASARDSFRTRITHLTRFLVSMYLARMYLLRTLFLCPLLETGLPFLRGHPSFAKVQPFVAQRKYLHFSVLSYFNWQFKLKY